jgi:hypothetical protein
MRAFFSGAMLGGDGWVLKSTRAVLVASKQRNHNHSIYIEKYRGRNFQVLYSRRHRRFFKPDWVYKYPIIYAQILNLLDDMYLKKVLKEITD